MKQFFTLLDEALEFKLANEHFIGKYSNSEEAILKKIIIVQQTLSEFGIKWAEQREIFEEPDLSKSISKEEFEKELEIFEKSNLDKKEGYFYEVLGVFHLETGEPRFQPMHYLISNGFS